MTDIIQIANQNQLIALIVGGFIFVQLTLFFNVIVKSILKFIMRIFKKKNKSHQLNSPLIEDRKVYYTKKKSKRGSHKSNHTSLQLPSLISFEDFKKGDLE